MSNLALSILVAPGILWVLGSIIYAVIVWRDTILSLRTPGQRWLAAMDVFVFLFWPPLLLIDLMLPLLERFKRARDY